MAMTFGGYPPPPLHKNTHTSGGIDALSASDIGAQPSAYTIVSTSNNLLNGDKVAVDTTSAALTSTLPSAPVNGDTIYILDYAGTFDSNNLTIARNGNNIESLAEDLVCNVQKAAFSLVYAGSTVGWKVVPQTAVMPSTSLANTWQVNQTFNGTNNTAPNQTAASGSSIMTRQLTDERLDFLVPRWHEVPSSSFSALTLNGGTAGAFLGNSVGCYLATANNIGSHAVANHLGLVLNYLTTGLKGLLWQRPFTVSHSFSLINGASVCKTWLRIGATNIFHVNPPPAEPNYVSAGWVVEEVTTNLIRFRSYSYSSGAITYGNEVTLGGQFGNVQLAPITFVTTSDGTTIKVGVVNRLGEVVGVSQVAAPTETTEYNPVATVGLISDGINAAGVRTTYLVGSVKWSSLSVNL